MHMRDGNGESEGRIISREEAMLRRLWDSRDVFERPISRIGMRGSGSGIMVGGGSEGRED